jgi:hypothetical protein
MPAFSPPRPALWHHPARYRSISERGLNPRSLLLINGKRLQDMAGTRGIDAVNGSRSSDVMAGGGRLRPTAPAFCLERDSSLEQERFELSVPAR